ncbi:NDR1/HIN1-like protein 13 [Punica granatum]|uniref:Late embryogenesis abundant protein LEA-2 subgroup domain-containing protein n=2 Tax=Punica granatum TaxID=22663 RepID=A0A218WM74_PUNGR|nr:NDR1/HIN1-like protein 13 [Punica granatum]XP_031385598.1 NDR1/HIN1-like protein 13 [Punica granatum]OWM73588.1 hypothetical protein CDL15_Pgr026687 [Punica granatum]PKI40295.1 hypothetical protein CRG98_039320 [Punica granatum]
MADRVHPHDSPSYDSGPQSPTKIRHPPADKPVSPPSGTYVIQIPKDQIYRVPPPENATRVKHYSSSRKPRRSCCRRRCCCLLFLILAAVILAGIAAAVFYFVVKPEAPDYSVTGISISGLNLTSSSAVSPAVDVTVRAANGNDKIGIYYREGSSVDLYYSDIKLCDGALPAFYQPTNNVTVFKTALRGSGIVLTSQAHQALVTAQTQGKVPLKVDIRAPLKFKVGAVKTWEITVKVTCDVTVDKLTSTARIESTDCGYGVDIFS